LQFDHVLPHSHGGRSSLDNVVISCALCNYGKDKYTLRQLDVTDPRLTPPVACEWDGLERFRAAEPLRVASGKKRVSARDGVKNETLPARVANAPLSGNAKTFFFPAARFSRGYLYTLPIGGKERWFKIDQETTCVPAMRRGVAGYLLSCEPAALQRRGIEAELFVDRED
jgi:hypothetical protein